MKKMNLLTKKRIVIFLVSIISLTTMLGLYLYFILYLNTKPVLFASSESKTKDDKTVYNKIKFISTPRQDIWMMQQSHHGLTMNSNDWDRLAIVLDKTTKPYKSYFYQLSSGDLNWSDPPSVEPYKARCYACHPSGPRAIRPNFKEHKIGFKDRLKIALWNLRIKTYGPVESLAGTNIKSETPFKSEHPLLNQSFSLESCNKCHNKDAIRSEINHEHLDTMIYLLKTKAMPPFPFKISKKDKKKLKEIMEQVAQ